MTSIADRHRQPIVSAALAAGLYAEWRAVWWTGLAPMIAINFHMSTLAEWIDRDATMAAAR